MLVPKLVTTLKTYTRQQFAADLVAGLIVGVVALPLAIAFAIASGVTPGETVVLEGQLGLVPGTRVEARAAAAIQPTPDGAGPRPPASPALPEP